MSVPSNLGSIRESIKQRKGYVKEATSEAQKALPKLSLKLTWLFVAIVALLIGIFMIITSVVYAYYNRDRNSERETPEFSFARDNWLSWLFVAIGVLMMVFSIIAFIVFIVVNTSNLRNYFRVVSSFVSNCVEAGTLGAEEQKASIITGMLEERAKKSTEKAQKLSESSMKAGEYASRLREAGFEAPKQTSSPLSNLLQSIKSRKVKPAVEPLLVLDEE